MLKFASAVLKTMRSVAVLRTSFLGLASSCDTAITGHVISESRHEAFADLSGFIKIIVGRVSLEH